MGWKVGSEVRSEVGSEVVSEEGKLDGSAGESRVRVDLTDRSGCGVKLITIDVGCTKHLMECRVRHSYRHRSHWDFSLWR